MSLKVEHLFSSEVAFCLAADLLCLDLGRHDSMMDHVRPVDGIYGRHPVQMLASHKRGTHP